MLSHGRFRLTPAALALAVAFTPPDPALAEAPAADGATTAEGAPPVVVVTATRTARDPLDVPASVDVIDREDLHDAQLRVNASETLDRLPGVVALNRQNYAQDVQVSMRGFGARSSFGVRGLQLYVDGVPATLPDGQGQTSNFPLNAADRIEVLRGPFSALYGNSSGGVIALTTTLKPGPLAGEASVAAGSFKTTREGLDLHGGDGQVQYAANAEQFNIGGYRPHSAADRGILNFRAGFLDTPLGELRLSANSLESANAQDPLGLTRAQLQANPQQTTPEALTFNTRKSTRQGTLGADLQSNLGFARLETSVWLGDRGIEQFQSIPITTQRPAGFPGRAGSMSSPGGVIDLARHFGGADSHATFETGIFTTTAGLNFQRLVEDRAGYESFTSPLTGAISAAQSNCGHGGLVCGVEGNLRRQETNSLSSLDPYVQTEAVLADRWRAFAGVRSSHVSVDSSDHFLRNGNDSGSVSYSAINPTAGIAFRATPRITYYAAYGRGFETPTLNELAYRPDGSAGINTSLKAARSNNYEIGAKTRLSSGLSGTVALFSTWTADDIVTRTNVGGRSAYDNVGKTRRDGVEVSIEAHPVEGLSLAASGSLIDAQFQTRFFTCTSAPCTTPNRLVAAGSRLPSVPGRTAWAQVRYDSAWGDAWLEMRAQSGLYVNDLNSDHAGGATVFNAVYAVSFRLGTLHPHLFARVDNLTDRRYVGSVIVNESTSHFFEPAPGRACLFGLDVPF